MNNTVLEQKFQKIYEKYVDDNENDLDGFWEYGFNHSAIDDVVNANMASALKDAREEVEEMLYMLRLKIQEEIGLTRGNSTDISEDTKFRLRQLCYELQGIIEGSQL